MRKSINIVLPDQIIEALEFKQNFTINKIGFYEKAQGHDVERAGINEAIVILCLEGCGFVSYENKNYRLKSGDVAFLEPKKPHRYGAENSDPWSILWVHFSGDGASALAQLFNKYGIDSIFRIQNLRASAEELNNIILLLEHNFNSIDIHKACSLLQIALLNFIDGHIRKPSPDRHYIKKATEFMKDNLENNINLDALSCHLGITPFHAIRVFKSALNITPMQHYNNLRINEAARLLVTTDLAAKQISDKLNYSNQFHFSQQFKKVTGFSPIAYKKSMTAKY